MTLGKTALATATALLTMAVAGAASAQAPLPYPHAGTYNNTSYTFTAMATGDVVAYFADINTASFVNELGLEDNGVLTAAGYGLNNHTSTIGQSFDFGPVTAGDTLTFVLNNLSLGKMAYSNPALNVGYDTGAAPGGGHNHIYSTDWDGTNTGADAALLTAHDVPHGVYVAFEDEPFPDSDYNYHDEVFVFTNVGVTGGGVPEPATWAMMIIGLGGLGGVLRFRRHATALAA